MQDKDEEKTKEQLINELRFLRRRFAEAERVERLTGLYKSGYFKERLEEEFARSSRYRQEFSLIMFDLDYFETYIERHGDKDRQEILGLVGHSVHGSLRRVDIGCYYGGSKFAVILPHTGLSGAQVAAEKLRQTIERVLKLKSMFGDTNLTISLGIASFPVDEVSSEGLVKKAGAALDVAKHQGGNQVCSASTVPHLAGIANDNISKGLQSIRFKQYLEEEVAQNSRSGQAFSLIVLELDNLKTYGELYEHEARDEVQEMVGVSVCHGVRQGDKVERYGENAWAVILPRTDYSGAIELAEGLRQTVKTDLKEKSQADDINWTISLGIVSFPDDEMSPDGLIQRVDAALTMARKRGGNQLFLASDVSSLTGTENDEVLQIIERVKEQGANFIYTIAAAVDARNPDSSRHSQNVAEYAVAMGKALGLSSRNVRQLRLSALIHDVGKICIPDNIINKTGQLDAEEWKIMKKHPEVGADIVSQIPELADCALAIRHHHERYNGSGYPSGLKGKEIPQEARIIGVAEAYDNMTTPRPYRQTLTLQGAIEELKRQINIEFDPETTISLIKALSMGSRI